jgi:hypothetical protein
LRPSAAPKPSCFGEAVECLPSHVGVIKGCSLFLAWFLVKLAQRVRLRRGAGDIFNGFERVPVKEKILTLNSISIKTFTFQWLALLFSVRPKAPRPLVSFRAHSFLTKHMAGNKSAAFPLTKFVLKPGAADERFTKRPAASAVEADNPPARLAKPP